MPVTVGHILRELDRRNFANGMAALADIATTNHDLVTQALATVPKSAKVDVAILVETLTRQAEERHRNQPEGEPWRYALTLMTDAQLAEFRRLVDAGNDPDDAAQQARDRLSGIAARASLADVEPDIEVADDEPPRRGRVPRYRPGTAGKAPPEAEDARETLPAGVVSQTPRSRSRPPLEARRPLGARLLRGRAFIDGEDITPDDCEPFRPPWLLPPDGDEEAA